MTPRPRYAVESNGGPSKWRAIMAVAAVAAVLAGIVATTYTDMQAALEKNQNKIQKLTREVTQITVSNVKLQARVTQLAQTLRENGIQVPPPTTQGGTGGGGDNREQPDPGDKDRDKKDRDPPKEDEPSVIDRICDLPVIQEAC